MPRSLAVQLASNRALAAGSQQKTISASRYFSFLSTARGSKNLSLSRQTNNLDDGHEKTSGVTSSVVKVKIVFRRRRHVALGGGGMYTVLVSARGSWRAASSIPCVLAKDQATLSAV